MKPKIIAVVALAVITVVGGVLVYRQMFTNGKQEQVDIQKEEPSKLLSSYFIERIQDVLPVKLSAGSCTQQQPFCKFSDLKLPSDFSVFAAGESGGRPLDFQIDQSGHDATQIDVLVNSSKKPVVLMLGAYEPTIWNIVWAPGTEIAAVMISGYHRQVVAGLKGGIPVLVDTCLGEDGKIAGLCNNFYVTAETTDSLNTFSGSMFGRPVDMVYLSHNGEVVVGDPLPAGAKVVTSSAITPESFHVDGAVLAGKAGLDYAVRNGLIREATTVDVQTYTRAWGDLDKKMGVPDAPPISGQVETKAKSFNGPLYIVMKPFVYPTGLYGANSAGFIIPKGVPRPSGDKGHSSVYDFNVDCNTMNGGQLSALCVY